MTCIIGYVNKRNKNVIIAGDSAGSNGTNLVVRKDRKIFMKGDFAIGCTTSFRMIQLLMYKLEVPPIGTTPIHEYMCTDFVDAIRKCFKDGGFLQKDKDQSEMGGVFLVGYEDRLFKIESDFQVSEGTLDFDAVGCGDNFALGALYALQDIDIPVLDKIKHAMHAAENLGVGIKSPFYFIETEDKYIKSTNHAKT